MQPTQILTALKAREKDKNLESIAKDVGVSWSFLWSIKNWKSNKYRQKWIDKLYSYFSLTKDKWYYNNKKMWYKKTFSVIWNIMRIARIHKGRDIKHVAKLSKWDVRQISRIELWDSLPLSESYYISRMLENYDFEDEEKDTIRYGIIILQDLIKIFKKLDDKMSL